MICDKSAVHSILFGDGLLTFAEVSGKQTEAL